jgi:hypothetical protein
LGITTEDGKYIPLKTGMKVKTMSDKWYLYSIKIRDSSNELSLNKGEL